MKKTFTLNDLLLYHYNELPSHQVQALEHQLSFDDELKSESMKIEKAKLLLNLERRKPSFSSVRMIMDYNRQSSSELEAC